VGASGRGSVHTRVEAYLANIQRSCAILSSAACLAPPHFSTLSHKLHDFRKNGTEYKMCVLLFPQYLLEIFRILRIIQRVIINMKTSSCNVPVIIVIFWGNLNYFDRFSRKKKLKYQISLKSIGSRVVPCGQTGMMKVVVAFRNSAKAPKNHSKLTKRMNQVLQ
jgi:hypothetical protein